MPPIDLALQVDLGLRLLLAAALGATIGVERELHEHPAGTRTHLLVSLGSALFTVLSIYGFVGLGIDGTAPVDPSRVAAQIVTGIGFLGAGAIIKYGTSIRGLTTAASLWITAAVGMAAGAGQWILAIVATALVVFSLGPLPAMVRRIYPNRGRALGLRLDVARLDAISTVSQVLADRGIVITGISTERTHQDHYEIDLNLRIRQGSRPKDLLNAISAIPDVEVLESAVEVD
jgi:putative Mg2+ transporter-C (MgtC) family protein